LQVNRDARSRPVVAAISALHPKRARRVDAEVFGNKFAVTLQSRQSISRCCHRGHQRGQSTGGV